MPLPLIRSLILTSLVIFYCNPGHAELVTYPLNETAPTTNPENSQPALGDEPARAVENNQAPSAQTTPTNPDNSLATGVQDLTKPKFSTCTMQYRLKGFSLAYKQYDGTGDVTCRNGQKAHVVLSSKSIGFTIGKSEIEGEAHFSDVKDINEIYGNYVSLDNHFGFIKSLDRQVLTSGEISLVMMGYGRGIDIGFTLGNLSISRH